jgi:hypothetical protein
MFTGPFRIGSPVAFTAGSFEVLGPTGAVCFWVSFGSSDVPFGEAKFSGRIGGRIGGATLTSLPMFQNSSCFTSTKASFSDVIVVAIELVTDKAFASPISSFGIYT